jgi:2-polyprenyl-6-methoxyphenol hydroxylase-like FAD-dependent oxidoreductase
MDRPRRDQALVLGAGMAGLLAARVLTESYRRVTLVDRDDVYSADGPRRGVPQGRHIHALLAAGQQALETLFPGLTRELVAVGAQVGDNLADTRICFSGHRLRRGPSGLTMLSLSRPFLERHVRARVLALPNVGLAAPSDIAGLVAEPDGGRITGARVFRRLDGSAAEVLPADLVVDATGRGSRTPRWLAELGYDQPGEELVGADLSFTTCCYRLPPDALAGDLGCLVGPTPEVPRVGALARLEGDRWILTVAGGHGDHPPVDPAELVEFTRLLSIPDIYETIRDAVPFDRPVTYRFPGNLRRRYDQLPRLPDGLVVLGDAVCSLNPIYGQGMTVAALQALSLREHLRRHPVPQPRVLSRRLAQVVAAPWNMATGGDLAIPGARGPKPRLARLMGAYITRLHEAAAGDAELGRVFLRVSSLVAPPPALLVPGTVARVLRQAARRSVAGTRAAPTVPARTQPR